MELKEGYKMTEVGEIPENWIIIKLRDLAQIETGSTPPTANKTFYGGDYFFVGPGDLNDGKWISDTEKKLSKKGFDLARKFPARAILFTCIGSTIGKCGMADRPLSSNQQINAVFPNSKYNSDFVYYALSMLSNKIKALAGEQAVPIVNKTQFGYTLIVIPKSNKEQTAIANALSDVDALISSLEKLVEKKKRIKEGAMQQLLQPKEGWVERKLGDLGYTYGGLSGKSKQHFENGTQPYIPFMNVMANVVIDETFISYVKILPREFQNKVCCGDLLFNGSSETPEEVGMCAVYLGSKELYLNSFCFGFRFFKDGVANGIFMSYFFRSTHGRKLFYSLAQGATRYNLSKSSFLAMNIKLPALKKQRELAAFFVDVDRDIAAMEQNLSKYRQIKKGMMQNLLTGKIRLVKQEEREMEMV